MINPPKPIVSLSYDYRFVHKCFTFFSQLNKSNNAYKNFHYLRIFLNLDKYEYFNNMRAIMIGIHSPNDLPMMMYSGTTLLNRNNVYVKRYTTYKIERLGRQYDTNCLDYERDSKFVTRHDCIKSCYIKRLNRICNGTALLMFGFLLRTWPKITKFAPCPTQVKIMMNIYFKCSESCKMNCHDKYYEQRFDREGELNETIIFIIKDHNMPDITIRHIPEISLTSLICNFGGLLGMWLGLSFLHIMNTIYVWFNEIIKSRFNLFFNFYFNNPVERRKPLFERSPNSSYHQRELCKMKIKHDTIHNRVRR